MNHLQSSVPLKASFPRYSKRVVLSTLFALGAPALIAAPTKPLRSPWDGKPVPVTDAAYTCPAITHIAPDLVTDGFYRLDDPTHSIIDPVRQEAYRKSSDGVKAVGMAIVAAADDYRTTGSRKAAQCALTQTLTLAQDHSLAGKMSSNQAYYVQGWVVGAIAIAYLKIRETDMATPEQTETIAKWMQSVGDQTIAYYDGHKNRETATVKTITCIGLELNSRQSGSRQTAAKTSTGRWQPTTTESTRSNLTVRCHSRWPEELERCTIISMPLLPSSCSQSLEKPTTWISTLMGTGRFIGWSINQSSGLQDPTPFEKATGVHQEVPKVVSGDQIGWAPPYVKRFPNAALEQRIKAAPSLSVYYLGGLPPA